MNPQRVASASPSSPHEGTGLSLDVHEFASSLPITQNDEENGSSFTYTSGQYPSGYRGYRLQANVSQIQRIVDPIPNGSFEDNITFADTWNLTNMEPGDPLVQSHSAVTGEDPQDGLFVMDVEFPDKKLLGYRTSYIDNEFNYTSTYIPNSARLLFDIRLSGDITDKDYYQLTVTIWNQGSIKGEWTTNLKDLKDAISDHWSAREIPTTLNINGEFLLRITFEKTTDKNEDVNGHIYFDNFRYIIGSQVTPTEANLTLNGEPFIDSPTGQTGSADIYADFNLVEAVLYANCWSTDQTFQFYSTTYGNLTFNYEYAMHVKSVNPNAVSTSFSAPVEGTPTWTLEYSVPSGRPPTGHERYSFGLHLQSGWEASSASGSLGPLSVHLTHPATNFVRIGDGEAEVGETCSIYVTSPNYVQEIILQKRQIPTEPWTNLTSNDYYLQGDYIRVIAELKPIVASPSNFGNISIYFPNGTNWHNDPSVDIYSVNNTLVSDTWQHTDITDDILGQQWVVTVAFDNDTQCGNLQTHFIVVIDTDHTRVDWTDGTRFMWGTSIDIEVIWNNSQTHTPITDVDLARVRYLDRNLVIQYVTMTLQGVAYKTSIPTTLMQPNPNAMVYVELYRYGCVNKSYDEGTAISFTFNLVNTIELVMIKPTQNTGPYQYTGETSATAGYTCIVKFFDPYQNAYVLDESATWPDVIVNYTRYDDPTGPTGWTEVSTGEFTHNPVDRTFSKNDASYGSLDGVRYNVSMGIEGTSWEYQTHYFLIIINIVNWATDLDVERTTIDYPPIGDGWTLFDQTSDNYDVHLYWNELLNVTVFYHFDGNTTEIASADSKQILVGTAPLENMVETGNGYYHYMVDTSSLTAGLATDIYVNITKAGHASQTILIQLFVESRKTQVTTDYQSSTIILPWSGTFALSITYSDIVTGVDNYINDAILTNETDPGLPVPTFQNWGNGTYTIYLDGNAAEGTYSILLNFSKSNYQTKLLSYELTIRPVFTLGISYASPPNIPWGDNVTIILTFNDTEFNHGIRDANITFPGQGLWEINGTDYWIIDFKNGTYLLLLNTASVPEGFQTYSLTITFMKEHYQTTQSVVSFQVSDVQTLLLISDTPHGTLIPHGDILVIILQFNDTSHLPFLPISGASIGCNWDPFFYSVTSIGLGVYNITIQTEFEAEGTYLLDIWATKPHHRDATNILIFRIEKIRTAAQAVPDFQTVSIGDNATFTITYFDLDHPGVQIFLASVNVSWALGYYSIVETGLGTYIITLNTSVSTIGSHTIQIDLSYLHCEPQTLFVTLEISRIQLSIQVLDPVTLQWDVEYNIPVNITVYITDNLNNPVNDAEVTYSWAGRGFKSMIHVGNGLYNITFLANATIGPFYQVTIQASNNTKYASAIATIHISINPTGTKLENITLESFDSVFGDTFVLSVNFTTLDGLPINGANVSYRIKDSHENEVEVGFFENAGEGIYNVTINPIGFEIGQYKIYVSASKPTMLEREFLFTLNLERIPTTLISSSNRIEIQVNSPFEISVTLYDIHNDVPISHANLTLIIEEWIFYALMENLGNGTFVYRGNSGPNIGFVIIAFDVNLLPQYEQPAAISIQLIVNPDPFMQNIGNYVAIAAVIGILVLILWLAYVRVFSVPWVVRKMRKMSKTIDRGNIPALSMVDRARISDRTEMLSEIADSYYESLGMAATPVVIPAEIKWDEKDAEDEAIWSELKGLPILEYEQKLELFQQMKQIAPSERVWFIEDLRKQMADGTRFARKPKEPEVSEDVEKELQARLATFPALSNIEKARIAAQLRKMPKGDWDEIFHTLAIAETPVAVTVEDELAPDEYPSLTEEERQKVLEEIKDLSPEERQKVLQTLREKRTETTPKGKVVKGKKEFVVDDSKDE